MDRSPAAEPAAEKNHWIISFISGRHCRWCILIALAVVLLPPEDGLGIDLCMMKRMTGAPCPGCGVTRCGSNMVRGHFRRAFEFNPFGFILHPILFALVCLSLLPDAARASFARRLIPWQRTMRILNIAFWTAFFIFGMVRWAAVMSGVITFPTNWLGHAP